ncbi:MAG: hypothetical protein IT432_04505 [Phycisphaerales bacterium]|nr:hypothetical protein [Phycisphaerales bacterium]
MTALGSAIEVIAAKAKRFGDRHLGEQNTKASLIEPLLEALGWDIRDPDEVHREYRAKGRDKPVDYALKLMRKPRLFLEAKGLGESLGERKWITQVLGYAVVAGVEWCVLTDGDEYCFYNATAPLDADEKRFCSVRLSQATAPEAEEILGLLSRKNLEDNLLDVLWVGHFVDRRVKSALTSLLSQPDKRVVELVRKEVPKLSPRDIADSIRRLDVRIESAVPRRSALKKSSSTKPARSAPTAPSGKKGTRQQIGVQLADLISSGLLATPLRLFCHYLDHDLEATLRADGTVEFQRQQYPSCSTAAEVARGSVTGRRMNTNGWTFWKYKDPAGEVRELDSARKAFLQRGTPSLRLSKSTGASA